MIDKNLFVYDLAVAAIFKDEGKYLKEWLDYHLLAGVEHFYLYNNDSSDDYAEVLAPYLEKNLVTLTNFPGKSKQVSAYDDAIERHRFECRYIAFIDIDEFIFPKTNRSLVEVVDEIFLHNPDAAALGINMQIFGSGGQTAADYSRGVLERFTRRAPQDWIVPKDDNSNIGNIYIKSVVNPRRVDYFFGPHYAIYFKELRSINSNGTETHNAGSYPIAADKIVVNHYYTKSLEEFTAKVNRGSACRNENHKKMEFFKLHDRNEEFDDDILKYRAARADNFSLEDETERLRRTERALLKTLTQCSPLDAPPDFFVDKLETFLTCRALAEKFGSKLGSKTAEEYALVWIYQLLVKVEKISCAEIQQFMRALPEILSRPFPFCEKILRLTQNEVIPSFCNMLDDIWDFETRAELLRIQKFLRLIN